MTNFSKYLKETYLTEEHLNINSLFNENSGKL